MTTVTSAPTTPSTYYETGPSAYSGPGNTEQAYLSEAGFPSAAWMAESWLMGQQMGRTPIQNEYQLAQIEFGAGIDAPIWGEVHDFDADFGPAFPHLRPIAMGHGNSEQRHRRGLLSG